MASMMPAYNQTSVGSLPDIDEATTPFSSLFDDNFDRATVEATVPLADRAIFVASNGRRFKFETISDEAENGEQSDGRRGSRGSSIQSQVSTSPTVHSKAPLGYLAPPRDYRAPGNANAAAIRRRPVSGASPGIYQHASGRGPSEALVAGRSTGPTVAPEDLSPMMEHLNIHKFSAQAFYGDSDGGVLAAETLTDLDPNPRLPIPPSPTVRSSMLHSSPASANRLPNLPASSYTAELYSGGMYARQSPVATAAGPVDPNYDYRFSQMDAHRHPSMPSLVAHSSPVSHSAPTTSMLTSPTSPQLHPGYQTSQSPVGPSYASPPQNAPSPGVAYPYSPQFDDGRRRSEGNSYYGPVSSPPAPTNRVYNIPDGESHFDTQTPVVVIPSRPQSRPHQGSTSSRSDGASTGRDNVLPGEDILYDGPVKIAQNLSTPFLAASLKAFRNALSHDLRFHWKIGHDSETYWLKGSNAQLIPVYAYDQRFPNVLYIRDNDSDGRNGAMSPGQGNVRPGGFYQFSRLQELCDFQAKLTGEKVVLDISSVRLLRYRRSNSRSNESFSSVRVQIWHEEGGARRGSQSDSASFVTAGTTLSGPLRERRVPNSSRLIVFLGRLDEYITVFITDDVEAIPDGQTMVKIRPRKGGKLKRSVSRWPGVKAHQEPKKASEPAGFNIDGQKMDPDSIYSYDLYDTFDIEFENSPSQDNFVRKWDEVIKERRQQRINLEKIDETMKRETFTPAHAREIW